MHEFRKIADGAYAFIQPAKVWHSNAGVIIGEKDVIVVDSMVNRGMTSSLLNEIGRITDKPVRLLVNTHSHADHVYTNHMFPDATVIASVAGRKKTRQFMLEQHKHDETFKNFFPDMDLSGGRYTLQDLTFTGELTIYQDKREVRIIEIGAGHSESDVIVHLSAEKIVFCGDVFMNRMPPMPLEGHLSGMISNLRKLEELQAQTYIPGHGQPGTLEDVKHFRVLIESLGNKARDCFDKGLSYDEAMATFTKGSMPLEFVRPAVLGGYCEWLGKMPETSNPADISHIRILQEIAERILKPGA